MKLALPVMKCETLAVLWQWGPPLGGMNVHTVLIFESKSDVLLLEVLMKHSQGREAVQDIVKTTPYSHLRLVVQEKHRLHDSQRNSGDQHASEKKLWKKQQKLLAQRPESV